MIITLIAGLIKKILLYKNELFPPHGHSKNKIKTDLDQSNYAIKSDLENVTAVDTSGYAKKDDLDNLKSYIGELDIDELKNTPTDLVIQ